ncbi:hypothetical protein NDU88_009347 [Pleurodeles waltl]|uniref:Uncharacterized protein n=1 Tax=Pleurodeles waltl TaxID=8319 RepID=A0AAV7QV12_PLEWA|nr:hypothetical protein NDU88_009347 [Pleurodeles waltl]
MPLLPRHQTPGDGYVTSWPAVGTAELRSVGLPYDRIVCCWQCAHGDHGLCAAQALEGYCGPDTAEMSSTVCCFVIPLAYNANEAVVLVEAVLKEVRSSFFFFANAPLPFMLLAVAFGGAQFLGEQACSFALFFDLGYLGEAM